MRDLQQSEAAPFLELVAFVAVAEELSFTRAARRLGRDPSIVSRRVRALEARLRARLIERSTRSISLTEAGRRYLERATGIVGAIEAANREATGFADGEPHGHLRLALPASFGRLWLAPLLSGFLAAHPRVTIEADFSNRFVDLIGERYDLGVRLGPLGDNRLVARRIAERRRILCGSPAYIARNGHPSTPGDLSARECLVFSGIEGRRGWGFSDRAGTTVRVPVSGPLVSDDAEILRHAALAGLGIVLSTDWLVGQDIASGALVEILPGWQADDQGGIHIVTPSGSRHASKTHAFSEYLAARFAVPPWIRSG